jgi:hypothetical protein
LFKSNNPALPIQIASAESVVKAPYILAALSLKQLVFVLLAYGLS